MNEHDLLDQIGEIDGKYIENAAKDVKDAKETKKASVSFGSYAKWGSLAAAVCLLVVGIAWFAGRDGNGNDFGEGGSLPSYQVAYGSSESESGENGDPLVVILDDQGNGQGAQPTAAPSQKPAAKEDGDFVRYGNIKLTAATKTRKYMTVSFEDQNIQPSVEAYSVNADLSNVTNASRFLLTDEEKDQLAANAFVVENSSYPEFYSLYEEYRYRNIPVFVTTDSLMHTYHLYFEQLLKKTEKVSLTDCAKELTEKMYRRAASQYEVLKGSEWENAAMMNLAYFGVAAKIEGIPVDLPSEIREIVNTEFERIQEASINEISSLTNEYEDYTLYKPRGYYAEDELLGTYFRVMTWYGHLKFRQKSDELNRCALLISLSLNDPECYSKWSAIYEVTAFFVGEMDDLSYDEYWPLAEKIYGANISAAGLIGKPQEWEQFEYEITRLRAPKVMSSSDKMDSLQEDELEAMKSYCFLPQRYTLDADIFTNVCANMVKPNPNDPLDKRVMPDALDVPAAMGSDVALNLLVKAGNDRYPNYLEQVLKMREVVAESHEYWSSSLYGGWLFTLAPLLEEKEEGYPSFMTNLQWRTKNLESFLGSWTELKHDTILYAKQFGFAECGGDDDINVDDRGYVEPEPEFFARLQTLSKATMEGLDKLGFIDETDKEYLGLLSDLSGTLHDIAVKELQNQPLTDEEYELIKSYGGSLEHFWYGALYCGGNSNPEEGVINSNDMPVVADVATANGYCLEEAIGYPSKIYVVFPIDGELHIAAGAVSTYYQFVQPASERLTDSEWLDIYENEEVSQPGWTQSYR